MIKSKDSKVIICFKLLYLIPFTIIVYPIAALVVGAYFLGNPISEYYQYWKQADEQ